MYRTSSFEALTEISEDGESLSSGQIKLISFARALYGNYKIILLDEISSNMD
ncbi:ATP-binding cassette domain-containing protein [Anaerosacchariphilus polymeriproducens]|uniref:ATP-binding cassette domain-containing protein n=1 Tax=Anaerosacchariphilus polymeriproducens TaxID=1812858 RepID=A0A371AUK7_9FIRM|nr:ATP-binding cassette domain-containing protein [Anaerosacchariphilus polymeriproducens]